MTCLELKLQDLRNLSNQIGTTLSDEEKMGRFYANHFREVRSVDSKGERKVKQVFETACHYLNSLIDAQTEANSGTILPPVMDCLTAAADDIAETLLYIDRHRQALGLSMAIVHGDQQTYKRMLTLMIDDSSVAKWLLPKPGEWHFTAHFAEAMFHPKLGLWSHFIGWFTRQGDSGLEFCTETVSEGGFQIKKFDQYCMFLEAIICACTIYLSRYVPMHLLACPQTLRHIARSSGAYGEFMVASMLTFW